LEAGIRFTNRLADRWVTENNNLALGSGVALGDFDGDGLCDLYFCAIDGTNACYRNLGGWKFEDVTARAGVGGAGWRSTGAVFTDFDGDGRLDLLVSTLGRGVHSFRNSGDGRFQEVTSEAGLESNAGSTGMALGDIDGDGDLDLYVANYGAQAILRGGGRAEVKRVNGQWVITGPHAARLRMVDDRLEELGEPDVLYRNEGRGRFVAVPWGSDAFRGHDGKPVPAPWDFGLGVQIRDINADGFPDIYVCNDFQTVDRVWINDGTGRFQFLPMLAMRHQSYAAMGVDFADLDRDGRLDFMVVEMMGRTPSRRLKQLGGMTVSFPVPGRFENRPEVLRNTLFWNRGDGTYAEVAAFAGVEATDWSWQPVFLDVDLDGYEDLLVVNGTLFDVQDRDALDRIRTLGKQTPEQSRTNLMLYPRSRTPNLAYRNQGDLTFQETGTAWGFDALDVSTGVALADLDLDGDLDVVVNALTTGPLVYRNESARPRVAVRLRGRAPNAQGIGAHLTLSGGGLPVQTQEIVSGGRYLSGDDPIRVFAAGTATNAMRLEVVWRSGRRSVLAGIQSNALYEIDEPGATEVPGAAPVTRAKAVPVNVTPRFTDVSAAIEHRHAEEPFDDFARQPLLMKQLSTLGPGVGWVDLDGDGHDELIVGSGRGGMPAVFRGDGRGGFVNAMPPNAGGVPDDVTGIAAVTRNDGFRLALAGLSGYEAPGLRVMAVGLELAPDSPVVTGAPVRGLTGIDTLVGPMAVADFAGDGSLRVFVGSRAAPGAYPRPVSSRLFRQTESGWEPDPANTAVLENIGLVSGALASDLDADGFPELVLACEWGPIRILRNERGQLIPWDPAVRSGKESPTRLSEWMGWWNSVTAADLDGDGRMDLVAGNWGLNSPYRASLSKPLQFFHGDLGGRGVTDLVETVDDPELGILLPRRSMSALSQAMPALGALYGSHAAFSQVAVGQWFRQLELHPEVVQATTLASMVFLNRGDHFEAIPLPREAQFSPVFGIVPADFDGDGRTDLFLAQNFSAVRPEVPRLDGGRGLLLRGTGGGRFESESSTVSGLAIDGDQRGAASADFNEDGRVDLVVGQNGGRTRLFTNTTAKPGLRVRLQGPQGNPWGIGAVVWLRFEARDGPATEIHGGSGYWSQDSVVPVLATPETPVAAKVRWPGGEVVTYALPKDCREIVLERGGRVGVRR
jgi:hypothetical protein